MHSALDTFLNIEIFAFIGLLIWLYFKPVDIHKDESDDA